MSFRKYGGLDRAATNNIVRSNYATANNESITDALGLENSRIVCKSDLDLNGNSIINLESIYFIDNAKIYSNNLTIEGNLTIDGNLIVNGNIEIGEDLTVDRDLFVKRYAYIDDNATFKKSIIMNGSIGNYIEFPDNTKQYTASLAIPPETIVMWSKPSPPQYWTICNAVGTVTGSISGTIYNIPNLQNYFIVGAGSTYTVGGTGGNSSSSVILAPENLPPHTHTVSYPKANTGNSSWTLGNFAAGGGVSATSDNGPGTSAPIIVPTLPPYYALYYIMFTP